jgi:putative colanic acid biosynthesis glycosyltransferase
LKVLQINTTVNSGSTGRIAENIGIVLIEAGHESYIAYGRGAQPSASKKIKIGNKIDVYAHGLKTLLTDRHGFGSRKATLDFIQEIEKIQPDVIALHNLHGYYINIEVLFSYLKTAGIPVVWTLFDCWAFTGHCSYFDDVGCEKWKTQCGNCPKTRNYPRSLVDGSKYNFKRKQELFTSLQNLEIITHSQWLAGLVQDSFLREYKVHVTPSAIDIETFTPSPSNLLAQYKISEKKIILGCANIWSNRKGYADFLKLHKLLDSEQYQIVMIGLSQQEIKELPKGIIGLSRTESIEELAQWYTIADVFVNPTTQDNFPTTNLEALACGTPVVTYDTGGSPEAIDERTGRTVPKGDVQGLKLAIESLIKETKDLLAEACRVRAEEHFDARKRYQDYLNIFGNILKTSK